MTTFGGFGSLKSWADGSVTPGKQNLKLSKEQKFKKNVWSPGGRSNNFNCTFTTWLTELCDLHSVFSSSRFVLKLLNPYLTEAVELKDLVPESFVGKRSRNMLGVMQRRVIIISYWPSSIFTQLLRFLF